MLTSIEAERVRNRMSKEQLARKMNVSLKTYYNWVNEETDIPGSALLKLSDLFDVDIEYLLIGSIHKMDTEQKKADYTAEPSHGGR